MPRGRLLDSIQPVAVVIAHCVTGAFRIKRCCAIPVSTLSINLSAREVAVQAAQCQCPCCCPSVPRATGAPSDLDRRKLPDAPLNSDALKSPPAQTPAQRPPGNRVHAALEERAATSTRASMSQSGKTEKAGKLAADRVSYVTVGTEHAGQRLDNFLLRLARGVPKSHVYRIVRSGEVRVNRARASVDHRVQAGDELRIPPLRLAEKAATGFVSPAMPPVLFEDEHVLAVNKPAGTAAHGGSGIAYGLIEQVRAARNNPPFLELVHRLDRETSGVLLLAKTRRALTGLHAAMRDGEIDKHYLTLVAGQWHNTRQHVKAPLIKYLTGGGERRVSVDPQGRAAHTVFNRVARFTVGATEFSLLEAELHTGRTHQIRVHLVHLGFAIVGDDKYGDFDLNKQVARGEFGVPLRRMFLHAASIAFAHPVGGELLRIEAPLAGDCEDFLRGLKKVGPG